MRVPHFDAHEAALTVAEFTARFAPAFAGSWAEATRALLADPTERRTIELLAADAAAGLLREPVWVDVPTPDVPRPRVLNGMHRVVACAQAGVPVRYTTARQPEPTQGFLEAELTFAPLDDDVHDLVAARLRSFRVDAQHWTCSDAIFTVGQGDRIAVSALYPVPEDRTPQSWAATLAVTLPVVLDGLPAFQADLRPLVVDDDVESAEPASGPASEAFP